MIIECELTIEKVGGGLYFAIIRTYPIVIVVSCCCCCCLDVELYEDSRQLYQREKATRKREGERERERERERDCFTARDSYHKARGWTFELVNFIRRMYTERTLWQFLPH